MNLNIREMLPNERDYAYTQSYQLMSQSGCITLMRGDFGNGGKTFYPDYEDQIRQYRTNEFAAEFDSVKLAVLTDDEFERNEQGVPKWFNINYEDVDGNEMYQTFELKNFDETPYYSLESINDI